MRLTMMALALAIVGVALGCGENRVEFKVKDGEIISTLHLPNPDESNGATIMCQWFDDNDDGHFVVVWRPPRKAGIAQPMSQGIDTDVPTTAKCMAFFEQDASYEYTEGYHEAGFTCHYDNCRRWSEIQAIRNDE